MARICAQFLGPFIVKLHTLSAAELKQPLLNIQAEAKTKHPRVQVKPNLRTRRLCPDLIGKEVDIEQKELLQKKIRKVVLLDVGRKVTYRVRSYWNFSCILHSATIKVIHGKKTDNYSADLLIDENDASTMRMKGWMSGGSLAGKTVIAQEDEYFLSRSSLNERNWEVKLLRNVDTVKTESVEDAHAVLSNIIRLAEWADDSDLSFALTDAIADMQNKSVFEHLVECAQMCLDYHGFYTKYPLLIRKERFDSLHQDALLTKEAKNSFPASTSGNHTPLLTPSSDPYWAPFTFGVYFYPALFVAVIAIACPLQARLFYTDESYMTKLEVTLMERHISIYLSSMWGTFHNFVNILWLLFG